MASPGSTRRANPAALSRSGLTASRSMSQAASDASISVQSSRLVELIVADRQSDEIEPANLLAVSERVDQLVGGHSHICIAEQTDRQVGELWQLREEADVRTLHGHTQSGQ